MFISSTEKSIINARIELLEAKVKDLMTALAKSNTEPAEEKKSKGWAWNEKSKLAASERMKKYWADKKAKVAS